MNPPNDSRGYLVKMWAKPTQKDLDNMPKLYSTDKEGGNATNIVQGHFFVAGCDWYVTEYDPEDRIFFGFAILNGDYQMAEWGLISLKELEDLTIGGIMEVDYDKHWSKPQVKDVEKIKLGGGVYE